MEDEQWPIIFFQFFLRLPISLPIVSWIAVANQAHTSHAWIIQDLAGSSLMMQIITISSVAMKAPDWRSSSIGMSCFFIEELIPKYRARTLLSVQRSVGARSNERV